MKPCRILAIDYGARNVGLASSDEMGVTVQPLESIPNPGVRKLLVCLRRIVEEGRIDSLIVGLPLNMDGSSGEPARQAERFMERLRETFALPVIPVDERLSSVEAAQLWRKMSPRRKRKYRTADSVAAALILQRHLEGQ